MLTKCENQMAQMIQQFVNFVVEESKAIIVITTNVYNIFSKICTHDLNWLWPTAHNDSIIQL